MLNFKPIINAIKSHVDISGEVTIRWCDDNEIRALNHQFRGMDKPTNVLSFPNEEPILPPAPGGKEVRSTERGVNTASHRAPPPAPPQAGGSYLGDIAISPETIQREAKEQKKDPEDHLAHMVVHGVLHLLGYDHENHADADKMESLEISILAKLGIDNPYQ